ncbi:MAG: endonuclease/exonuclease/phosphatase family protein [Opitutaceae bacterium]|nr:endonuclease/exonuclease/phosphatase family protein [Opitutaceae bacterium]MBP9911925.1 endonuclease/exonuclease/phosphatase family protein [Opitutaceae bacterium]
MQRLRILTFNIAHGRGLSPIQGLTFARKIRANLRKIARLIEATAPDIVALQEIDQASRWAGNFDHLEYLRLHTGYPHAAFGINNRRTGLLNLNYGNAILSKHPILETETIVFGERTVGEKGFMYAEIDIGGRKVPLVNLHLHYGLKAHRFRQVERLMDYITHKDTHRRGAWHMPPIVCGDLNNPATGLDATAELMRYFSLHGNYSLHPQAGPTFPSPLPRRALDFVFLPPACVEVKSEVVRSLLSDHRPVLVEFSLK